MSWIEPLNYFRLKPLSISFNQGGKWFTFVWDSTVFYVSWRLPGRKWRNYCKLYKKGPS